MPSEGNRMLRLEGIFPPIPTSFHADESLALDKIKTNLTRLSRFDLAGFLVLGSNGEMVMLSESEKATVFEAAREAIGPDKLMLAGTGGQSTRDTISLSKTAAQIGADAVVVLNPSYYKSLMTTQALVKHYTAVADACPVPVIVYNMPACSGLDMTAETIVEISRHANVIGIKDSGGNVVKLGEVIRTADADFQFLAGSAGFLLPALSTGAVGGILALANIAPQQCLDICKYYLSGKMEKARKIQLAMIPVNTAVTSGGGVPSLKAAMDIIGLYGGPVRKPILPVNAEREAELEILLQNNNITLSTN